MPGKVNPVMAEMFNMVCYQVIGNDTTVAAATQASQLELNVMMPLIAHNLLFSIKILSKGMNAFAGKCLNGIKADPERCRYFAEANLALATALNPLIGYSAAAEVSKEAYRSGKTVKQVVLEKGILSSKEAEKLLDPGNLISIGKRKRK
jgi:fumarate hydratase class II